MENDRDWDRFLTSCKRAYYSYTRGNDVGAQRLCRDYGISICHVVDIALTNKGPKDDFLSPSDLLHTSIRNIEKNGGNMNDLQSLEGILETRTTREWNGGKICGKNRTLDELFPNPPQKMSDKDGSNK